MRSHHLEDTTNSCIELNLTGLETGDRARDIRSERWEFTQRNFNYDWTEEYVFILRVPRSKQTLFFLCSESIFLSDVKHRYHISSKMSAAAIMFSMFVAVAHHLCKCVHVRHNSNAERVHRERGQSYPTYLLLQARLYSALPGFLRGSSCSTP